MTKYKKIYPFVPAGNEDHYLQASDTVLKTLAYFDIFHYPLTREELLQYASSVIPESLLDQALECLSLQHKIFEYQGFYSIQNNPLLVYRRKAGNVLAVSLLEKAVRIGRFLYQFPFVTAVGISGSLSKNYADRQSDIDFFIITKANRLWIARTLMHLYKKLTFITGKQHYYCMNYYIDEDALPLDDRNIFTAIEMKTLLPVCGDKTMQQFFSANEWTAKWLPQCNWRGQTHTDARPSLLKRILEKLTGGKPADWLNMKLWKFTNRRWKKKEARRKLNGKGVPMGLITGIHFAKSNAGDFQEKVLALYQQKVTAIFSSPQTFMQASSVK